VTMSQSPPPPLRGCRIPQLGRFLSPDPEPGGSANAYDYSNQAPVNSNEPSGRKPYERNHGLREGWSTHWSPKSHDGRDSYGRIKARLYIRMACGSHCQVESSAGKERARVQSVVMTIEQGSRPRNNVGEHSLTGPGLEGEMPWKWENWIKRRLIRFRLYRRSGIQGDGDRHDQRWLVSSKPNRCRRKRCVGTTDAILDSLWGLLLT
jgi:hypothetical protein